MHAPEQKHLPWLRRQAFDEGLEPAKLVPRLDASFRRRLVRTEDVQVRDEIQRHDRLASQGVDEEIAGDREQIGAAGGHPSEVLDLIGARQTLGDQVLHVEAWRADAAQAGAHGRLVGQDDGLEPFQADEQLAHDAPPDPRFDDDWMTVAAAVAGVQPSRAQKVWQS